MVETDPETGQNPEASTIAPNPQDENHLEADDNILETDSTLSSTDGSSSYLSTLKSSIYNYRYENGRRYHAFREGTYLVPNDDEEQHRMDLVHHIYSLLLDGKLHLAPIGESPHRVLDLGTGTGIWAIDFAEVPNNCVFEVDDFEDQWLYKKPFDFIHARELEGCIAEDGRLFQQALQHLAPGGYIELQAMRGQFVSDDDTSEKATYAQRWAEGLLESSAKFGKPIDCVDQWKGKLEEAGFVDIHQEIRKVPIGTWPKDPVLKEVGKYQAIQSLQAIDSYTPKLFEHILGWRMEEIQVLMAQAKKELMDRSIHLYLPVYFIWARKP
ncbi:hypothetical protein AK830_g8526 [Neonectria ditissima]|uniref:Methyltransferase tdiE n=1 Tax=Neonectria ditissima TaxID=78410 RepID=A0A0P7BE40_9HYPO|nr:hypothetical protein AK830_g8526 [Neonectria ditissima]